MKDFQLVYSLQHLEELILDEPSSQFDFSKLKSNIKRLYLGYNNNVVGLDAIKDLEILNISSYKSNKNGLVNLLASNMNLHSLTLISCKIDASILSKVAINFKYMKTMELDAIGGKLNKNGTSRRANLQVNKWGKDRFKARVITKNVKGREAILEWERNTVAKLREKGRLTNKTYHIRP